MGNFSFADFFSKSFFFKKMSFRNTVVRVSNVLDPDQDRPFRTLFWLLLHSRLRQVLVVFAFISRTNNYWVIFLLVTFFSKSFFSKNSFRNTVVRVSNGLEPVQDRHMSVCLDLRPICLQSL